MSLFPKNGKREPSLYDKACFRFCKFFCISDIYVSPLFISSCDTLEIKNLVNKQIGELSGGQRQRVMLARTIIREPELIILDEPCSGLDINITKELYTILGKLHKEQGTTIIMATHDLEEIKTMDVRVICLATTLKFDGKISDWKGL